MKNPRCRARGGAASCKNPRCPQKRAAWDTGRAYVQRTMLNSTWGPTIMTSTMALLEQMRERYGFPVIGTSRAVYDMGNGRMLKVPYTDRGISASASEFDAFEASKLREPFIPVAACEFVQHGDRYLLEMERVEPLVKIDYKQLPDWVGYVDCAQVGYTAEGKLVAYDL